MCDREQNDPGEEPGYEEEGEEGDALSITRGRRARRRDTQGCESIHWESCEFLPVFIIGDGESAMSETNKGEALLDRAKRGEAAQLLGWCLRL